MNAKRSTAGAAPVRNVRERVIDTPAGPVQSIQWEHARPVEDIRDVTVTVRAYRMVAGLTETTEVFALCGHEVPRFDQSRAFAELTKQGVPARYPRSRLCPTCVSHPTHISLKRVTGEAQLVADWGSMPRQRREVAAILLQPLLAQYPSLPNFADWKTLTPEQRGLLAGVAEEYARVFGLTFHEFLSLNVEPAPVLSAAGLRRLKASAAEKEKRRVRRDDRALRAQWERDRR